MIVFSFWDRVRQGEVQPLLGLQQRYYLLTPDSVDLLGLLVSAEVAAQLDGTVRFVSFCFILVEYRLPISVRRIRHLAYSARNVTVTRISDSALAVKYLVRSGPRSVGVFRGAALLRSAVLRAQVFQTFFAALDLFQLRRLVVNGH